MLLFEGGEELQMLKGHQHICCTGAVYGTVVVASLHPNCGTGNEPLLVHRIASAMVWSTWIFSVILGCASPSPFPKFTHAYAQRIIHATVGLAGCSPGVLHSATLLAIA